MTEPNRPILRYFGGKWILAPWIISHFPSHRVYVEPYGGAASVLMRKKRSYAEVYNDLDSEIVRLFRILRDPLKAHILENRLRLTPFARDEFDAAYKMPIDEIDFARLLIIRAFMGFGADGHNMESGKTGFRANSNRSGSTPAHDWVSWPNSIKAFAERLQGVVIENRDAIEVMKQQDSEDALHFVDPPYVHDSRSSHGYKFELTDHDHETLCSFLQTLKGAVVLCGYENEIYKRLGWAHAKREAHADGARDRTEVLWFNEKCLDGQAQRRFDI